MKLFGDFEARLESLSTINDLLMKLQDQRQLEPELLFDLKFAIEEVFTNIIKYGLNNRSDERISVQLTVDSDSALIIITDKGRAFNPLTAAEPDLDSPLDESASGGLGIFLTKQLMDKISYSRVENINILTLEKYLPANSSTKE